MIVRPVAPVAQRKPRNLLTRWDVISIAVNGIFSLLFIFSHSASALNPVWPSSCVTPAGTSNELDVQNGWEENTHTHTHTHIGGQSRSWSAKQGKKKEEKV